MGLPFPAGPPGEPRRRYVATLPFAASVTRYHLSICYEGDEKLEGEEKGEKIVIIKSILFTSLFWLHSQAVLSLSLSLTTSYYNPLSLLDYCSICNENPTVVIFAPETIAMQASLITFLAFLLLDYQKFR